MWISDSAAPRLARGMSCLGPRPDRRAARQGGYVTAEAAVVLPCLVLLTALLMWGVAVLTAQLKCVDAAREGARAAARGDPTRRVVAVARHAGPERAEVRVRQRGGLIRVRVAAPAPTPGGLVTVLSFPLGATAAAYPEQEAAERAPTRAGAS